LSKSAHRFLNNFILKLIIDIKQNKIDLINVYTVFENRFQSKQINVKLYFSHIFYKNLMIFLI